MTIRAMEERDVSRVTELEKSCFSVPWTEKILLESLDNIYDHNIILEDADKNICGYAGMRMLCDEAEIMRIAIEPSLRGLGYGSKLMSYMVETATAHGAGKIYLEVRAGNTNALKLYKKYGFTEDGTRKNYYHAPEEDAVMMSRDTAFTT